MAACELEEGALLVYTDKGICIVNVPFDKDFWLHLREKLKAFFLEFVKLNVYFASLGYRLQIAAQIITTLSIVCLTFRGITFCRKE